MKGDVVASFGRSSLDKIKIKMERNVEITPKKRSGKRVVRDAHGARVMIREMGEKGGGSFQSARRANGIEFCLSASMESNLDVTFCLPRYRPRRSVRFYSNNEYSIFFP